MKESNFIKTLSPAQQKEMWYWLSGTLVLLIGITIVIFCVQAAQLHLWWQTRQEYEAVVLKTTAFDSQLAQKRKLKEEHAVLQGQLGRLEKYQEQKKNPLSYLTALHTLTASKVQLQSLRIQKKQSELVCICKDQKEAMRLSDQLIQVAVFKDMRLTSFKKSPNGVVCVFKNG